MYESLWSHSIPDADTLLAGFGEFEGYPPGQYTDDTQLSVATVESILRTRSVSPPDIARLWKHQTVIGPGGACTHAATHFLRHGDWNACGAATARLLPRLGARRRLQCRSTLRVIPSTAVANLAAAPLRAKVIPTSQHRALPDKLTCSEIEERCHVALGRRYARKGGGRHHVAMAVLAEAGTPSWEPCREVPGDRSPFLALHASSRACHGSAALPLVMPGTVYVPLPGQ
jgi:hypothetical protein